MEKTNIKTICYLCSKSGCGIDAVVQNGRLTGLKGDRTNSATKGLLCPKGKKLKYLLYASDRLTSPLKRTGKRGEGKWQRISWDEALGIVKERLMDNRKRHGPESVAFHKGYMHFGSGEHIWGYLNRLANVFGSPNFSCPSHICNVPRLLAALQMVGGALTADIEHANHILLWGCNPTDTNYSLNRQISAALKRNAEIMVIDPRATYFSKKADLHLQLRPGSDGVLALGMLRVIYDEKLFNADFVEKNVLGFEELKDMLHKFPLEKVERLTWVCREQIRKAARIYANSKAACIVAGNAIDQQSQAFHAISAIITLMAVCGHLNEAGGNLIFRPVMMSKNPLELHDLLSGQMKAKRLGNEFLLNQVFKFAHFPLVLKAILKEVPYPVKAMLMFQANPAITEADTKMVAAALQKLDFLAVADIFMTKTAELADIVLPACTFLEQTYYATIDASPEMTPVESGILRIRPQVVMPLGESRSDWRIISDLAGKMGFEEYFPWKNIEEAIDYELKPFHVTSQELAAQPGGIRVQHPPMSGGSAFWPPGRKIKILSSMLEGMDMDWSPVNPTPADLAEEYPFVLTTGKSRYYVHSQMHNIVWLNNRMPRNELEIHPRTAASLNIENGAIVIVETAKARIRCPIRLTKAIHPKVLFLAHGFEEANHNFLTDNSSFDPIAGAVQLRAIPCRIRAADKRD